MVSVCAQTTVKLLQLQGRTPLTPPKERVNGNVLLTNSFECHKSRLEIKGGMNFSFFFTQTQAGQVISIFFIQNLESLLPILSMGRHFPSDFSG